MKSDSRTVAGLASTPDRYASEQAALLPPEGGGERVRPPWLARGLGVGLAAVALFFAIHAVLVEPIWVALAYGVPLALVAGLVVALTHERLQPQALFAGARGGLVLGALVAASLVPFLVAGMVRTSGGSARAWAPILVGALALVALVVMWVAGSGAGWVALAIVGANWLPAFFLVYVRDFHDEALPQPVPMTLALATIEVAAGGALGWLARRGRAAASPR